MTNADAMIKVQSAVERYVNTHDISAWQHVSSHVALPQSSRVFRVFIRGAIKKNGEVQYFAVSFGLTQRQARNEKSVVSRTRSAFAHFESFADEKCACVPTPDSKTSGHCEMHRKMFGY